MNIQEVWPEWYEDCVLGEGSFGKVYRAKRVEYGRTFYSAIKEIKVPKDRQEIKYARNQGMNDAEIHNYFRSMVDNLLNEITLMDNLKGAKNIVAIEDYRIIEHQGEIGWDIFIRMELLTPFDSFVSNPTFSQTDVIKLGVDICSALEMCEQSNIIHRDIKPDNIFVSKFGEYKLGDFGIAKKLEGTQANFSRKGTLNYMSPEVYKGEDYGPNVDIYSLGMVMYTLLNNNRMAFLPMYPQPITYKDNEIALMRRLSGDILNPPCNASPTLGSIVLKACAFNPQDRYQSASQMKADLLNEWNYLAQSNANVPLCNHQETGDVLNNIPKKPTNEMSADGQVLYQNYQTQHFSSDKENEGYLQQVGDYFDIGEVQINSKSKIARIISFIIGAGALVFSLVCLTKAFDPLNFAIIVSSISAVFGILLSNESKLPIGISMVSMSVPMVLCGVARLIQDAQSSMTVTSVALILMSILTVLGGVTIIFQSDVKFGTSLCLYSMLVEFAYLVYTFVSDNKYDAFIGLYSVANCMIIQSGVYAWGLGFDKNREIQGSAKIRFIVSFVISLIIALISLICSLSSIPDLF